MTTMPKKPPRPLCLPELLADPQTKADYIQANPPRYGPNSRPPSTYEEGSIPPSPSSMYGFDSYRNSRTTSFGLPSPPSTASLTSSHTSLSIHNAVAAGATGASKRSSNLSQSSDKESLSGRIWSIGNITLGGDAPPSVSKPRATWSNTFKTKSWFGNVAAVNEAKQTEPSRQVEIKLSPSMVAAAAETETAKISRPLSSPYPIGNTKRSPRLGAGLQYYTEKNPAPPDIRKQIPDPVGLKEPEHPPTNQRPLERVTTLPLPSQLIKSLLHEKPLPGIRISFGDA